MISSRLDYISLANFVLLLCTVFFLLLQPLASHEWNGEPRGYTVHLRMIGVTDFTPITLNGTNIASTILGGLHEWVNYQVRMIAFNDVGGSPFSPVIVERTKESGILTSPMINYI